MSRSRRWGTVTSAGGPEGSAGFGEALALPACQPIQPIVVRSPRKAVRRVPDMLRSRHLASSSPQGSSRLSYQRHFAAPVLATGDTGFVTVVEEVRRAAIRVWAMTDI